MITTNLYQGSSDGLPQDLMDVIYQSVPPHSNDNNRVKKIAQALFNNVVNRAHNPREAADAATHTVCLSEGIHPKGVCLSTSSVFAGTFLSTDFSPCRKYIALTGYPDKTIRIWNVSNGTHVRTLTVEGHTDLPTSVAFSQCGNNIASGSFDGAITIWNVSDGTLVTTLKGRHTGLVSSIDFSPCRQYIASGSNDHTVKIWNVSDGTCIRTLTGHTEEIWSVAFSPCGKYIVSGSKDHTLRIWNVSDGKCIDTLTGHTAPITSIAFSPCGGYIVSGSYDSTLKVWSLYSPQQFETAIKMNILSKVIKVIIGTIFGAFGGYMLYRGWKNRA